MEKVIGKFISDRSLHMLEKVLALIVLGGVVIFALVSFYEFIQLDLDAMESYRFMLERILELAIGVELARLLISYSLDTVVELLAFVIARKLVLLESDFINLLFGIAALTLLFIAKGVLTYVELKQESLRQKQIEHDKINF